jgi:saccharopine dehydrogenase-like NADP-dependent oxidoreductase
VGTLLRESGFEVTGLDAAPRGSLPFQTHVLSLTDATALRPYLAKADAVVSCLPFHLNTALAKEAHAASIHYFDLTEDVATTEGIRELAKTSKGLMAPQCGLAPGFIGIVGADLARKFNRLRSIELKVGALPKHPRGKLGYAFNWSPEGVINEYINDCEVIRMGHRQMVPALEGYEVVVINGVQLEAATTSGGLGTMCETYDGKVETLHYKTMRYLGHFEQIKFLFQELRMQEDRALLGKIMKNALPPVAEDYVFVHAAVEGWEGEALSREEFVRAYPQMQVAGQEWRAISWTTAASLCAVIELVRDSVLPQQGFLKQEEIPLDAFFKTKNGAYYKTHDRS